MLQPQNVIEQQVCNLLQLLSTALRYSSFQCNDCLLYASPPNESNWRSDQPLVAPLVIPVIEKYFEIWWQFEDVMEVVIWQNFELIIVQLSCDVCVRLIELEKAQILPFLNRILTLCLDLYTKRAFSCTLDVISSAIG